MPSMSLLLSGGGSWVNDKVHHPKHLTSLRAYEGVTLRRMTKEKVSNILEIVVLVLI